jgi:hypothetical protein
VFDNTGRPHAQQFRDGFLYQHNLAAVRAVMDSQIPSAWESNLYMSWLACLQELSPPTVDAQYPEAMRTRAWAMKTLNTQLASWTQLRHDTILYAKQSYTGAGQCMYPKGFVEPRSAFWARLQDTATRAAGQLAALTPAGNYPLSVETDENGNLHTNWITMTEIQNRQVSHLQNFASVVDRLTGLARKELAQEAFTDDEQSFVTELMEIQEQNGIGSAHAIPRSLRPLSGGSLRFSGWYPQLFYRAIYWNEQGFDVVYGANANDAIVADVHTDVPSNPDPGSVLHEGIGHVNILLLAVNNGEDRFLCAGPVMSHYEFEVMDDPRRLSDGEWGGILDVTYPSDVPTSRLEGLAPPVWTRGYLVPSPRP